MEVLFPILILILLFSVARRLNKKVEYNKHRSIHPKRIYEPEALEEDKGENGENVVMLKLKVLPEDKYLVMHNVTIPLSRSTSQIDHLVISVYGLFVIETKNYSGSIYGMEHGEYWSQYLPKTKNQFYNPILQNAGHVRALRQYLQCFEPIPIIPIVVFSEKAILKVNCEESTVIKWNHLLQTINQYQEEKLTWDQVKEIGSYLQLVEMTKGQETDNQHLQNLQGMMEGKYKTIESGHCPRCGGELILREGAYGKFYGCSNYANCHYTQPC